MATLAMTPEDKAATERFKTDVLDPSATQLVIVDFWAEWCGPCKALTPTLEKVAAAYADRGVVLAKVNVDEDKFIAAQFQIRSIPTVYAVFQGQIVSDLTPARTEGQLTQALDSILKQLGPMGGAADAPDIEPLLAMGREVLDGGDPVRAVGIFSQIADLAPDEPRAHAGWVEALVAAGEEEAATAHLDLLPEAVAKDPAIAAIRSRLAIAANRADEGELAAMRQAAADPSDHAAQLALAEHEMAVGERDAAADRLLASIAADREWNDGAARAAFLRLLEAEGLTDPWASAQRRRLSDILFG